MRKFFRCDHCGNLIGMIHDAHVNVICCGQPMTELVPNTTDAAQAKHVPVVTVDGSTIHVRVGSADHPMTEEHLIEWIFVETKQGGQRKALSAGDAPAADFALTGGDEAVAVYAYCNLHGLWMTEI